VGREVQAHAPNIKLGTTPHDAAGHDPPPASSISAPSPNKGGEAGPPVAGRLPPAAEAAEAIAVLLAVAVAVALE
jgi:hypothetical protein